MYWWDRAAEILAAKGTKLRRFGLVTTNSITQDFSRRVIKKRMDGKRLISLVMAINDHPWTKATDEAAQVRIAMTVAERGEHDGVLREVVNERNLDTDQPEITFADRTGRINADLTIGVDVTSAMSLHAGEGLCSPGVKLHGDGFIVTPAEARHLGLGSRPGLEKHIRDYRNGRDLTSHPRGVMVIDLFGLDADTVRKRFPEIFQHVKAEVKEKIAIDKKGEKEYVGRDWNNRDSYKENWWVFGEPRRDFRPALENLGRYIATVETAKHRVFQFLPIEIVPDNMLICVADEDASVFGILSSRIHVVWALRAGGWLGVGNDPRYSKSKVFDPFPFPSPSDLLTSKIRAIAEELDAFRKERQKEHPDLTLTQMYNVLEKLRAMETARHHPLIPAQAGIQTAQSSDSGSPPPRGRAEKNATMTAELTSAEEKIKADGLILILKELHDKLDALVFEAYGWPPTLIDEQILEKLVALNRERAAEEQRGHVRWLRPDYQIPRFGKKLDKQAAKEENAQIAADLGEPVVVAGKKTAFPSDPVGQTAAVFAALAAASGPVDVAAVAAGFRKSKNLDKTIAAVLRSLARLGHVTSRDGKTFELRRAA